MSALSYLKAEALSLEGCNGKRWKPCGQLLCFSILYFAFSSASFCLCLFLGDGRWEMSEERLRSYQLFWLLQSFPQGNIHL